MGLRRGLRVGLVGAGGVGSQHLSAWLSLGAEVGVYTRSGTAALVARSGGTAVDTLDELLAISDVVDIAAPTPSHGELALAALAAGRPVVCEKPLARTSAEAERMIEAFEAAGLPLYPGHVVRFFGAYAALHAAVAAGAIGELAVQRFQRAGSTPTADWFHDDARSGGIVLDQCLHDLDFARWNAGEVATAYALESAAGRIRSVQILLTHVAGALSLVHGTWAQPGTTFRTSFDVAGTGGVLIHDSADHPALRTDLGDSPVSGGGRGLLPTMPDESPFRTELGEFLTALRGGPPPRVTARDGLAAIRSAEAAQRSLDSGRAEPVVAVRPAVHGPVLDDAGEVGR
jgi:predicted dehydrogenase